MNIPLGTQPLCNDPAYPADYWFPEPPNHKSPREEINLTIASALIALELCGQCPLQNPCLEFSFEASETVDFGIYGGTLPYERRVATGGTILKTQALEQQIRRQAQGKGIVTPVIDKHERPAGWAFESDIWRMQKGSR